MITYNTSGLPGHFPVQTLLKVVEYYISGLGFHFYPMLPVLHSSDPVTLD